ncbi:putative 40S ribosomal protein S16-1 [Blattamonas nauphoetae]|uniref:40S ribosomal protein S16-1 n=1 Tax=Blattamonas nauphoetae TaxID=2049346 RepID=A0ABQ9XL97_9EUKA|nr:putative 40S ribosomal protein S16-1 [Blattamonas nauphoetae]
MAQRPVKQEVQVFGRKKTAVAAARIVPGTGQIRLNGVPVDLIRPQTLRFKVLEPLLLAGPEKFSKLNIRIRCNGGGHISQVYAIRQAIAKGLVAYYQKYVDEVQKKEVKNLFLSYDRSLLVADSRRSETKTPGGKGARSMHAKSYR